MLNVCNLISVRERERERDWNTSNSDQGPPGTEPEGDIEVSAQADSFDHGWCDIAQ